MAQGTRLTVIKRGSIGGVIPDKASTPSEGLEVGREILAKALESSPLKTMTSKYVECSES